MKEKGTKRKEKCDKELPSPRSKVSLSTDAGSEPSSQEKHTRLKKRNEDPQSASHFSCSLRRPLGSRSRKEERPKAENPTRTSRPAKKKGEMRKGHSATEAQPPLRKEKKRAKKRYAICHPFGVSEKRNRGVKKVNVTEGKRGEVRNHFSLARHARVALAIGPKEEKRKENGRSTRAQGRLLFGGQTRKKSPFCNRLP